MIFFFAESGSNEWRKRGEEQAASDGLPSFASGRNVNPNSNE